MKQNKSDKSEEKVYDNTQDGKVIERVDLKKRPNLLDTNHQHEWYKDGSEDTDMYYSVKCRHCWLGMLVNK